jgi:hypothetical protein
MGCCWHAHGPWCYGPGYGWEPEYPARRRRRIGREEQMRDLEERQTELQEELAEISQAIRAMKEAQE